VRSCETERCRYWGYTHVNRTPSHYCGHDSWLANIDPPGRHRVEAADIAAGRIDIHLVRGMRNGLPNDWTFYRRKDADA
jgi:hypothetical protein